MRILHVADRLPGLVQDSVRRVAQEQQGRPVVGVEFLHALEIAPDGQAAARGEAIVQRLGPERIRAQGRIGRVDVARLEAKLEQAHYARCRTVSTGEPTG